MTSPSISKKALLKYGVIALPIAFAGFPLYVLAPDYFATQYGLSLSLLGVLLLAIRLFDAVQDPVIGWIVDRGQDKFIPMMCVAGIFLWASIYALFNTVLISPAVWFALCMTLAVSAYSVMTIVLGAQGTLWTTDKTDQTRIAGARESFGLVGLMVAVSMPALFAYFVSKEHVFIWYSIILGVLMLGGLFAFTRLARPTQKINASLRQRSLWQSLKTISPETKRLFMVYAISMLASSIPAVLVIFYVRDFLGAAHLTGVFLLLYFLSGVVGMPFWKKISMHVGKHKAWLFSMVFAVVTFIGAYFLNTGDIWLYGVVCVMSGLGLGADLTLPPSILADDIHANGHTDLTGVHVAFLAFIAKASLALASAIALPLLDFSGFKPEQTNLSGALSTLCLLYALLPCVFKIMAAGLLFTFSKQYPSGGLHEISKTHPHHRSADHA